MDAMRQRSCPVRATEARLGEADSLAPAVTRAAAILDVLAENAGEAAGPSELARRLGLPKSSIANICGALADAGLVRRVGTGFALGRRLAELGGAYLASVDQVQEFYEACPPAAGRLRGDRPARRPRRPRDDLPRPPRRAPAGPPDVADRAAPAGHRARRPARRRSPRSTTPSWRAGSTGVDEPAAPHRAIAHDASTRCCADLSEVRRRGLRDRRRGDHRGRRLLRGHDPEPAARRGPVRGEHHAPQGAGDRRSGSRRCIADLRWLAAAAVRPAPRQRTAGRRQRVEPVDAAGAFSPKTAVALARTKVLGQPPGPPRRRRS